MTAPVRVGLLGWSDVARRRFVPALAAVPEAVMAAVGSRDPARARAGLDGRSEVAVTDYAGLLADPGVELVYLSLPHHLHEEWTLRALAAGKHVLCEKPLAPSPAAVERMLAAAGAAGRLLFEGVMFPHHPQHAVVRDLLASGRLGSVTALRAGMGFWLRDAANFRLDPARAGGVGHDLLCYMASAAALFLPGRLCAAAGFARVRGGVDVSAQGVARTDAGALFTFAMSFEHQYESFYEISGERGRLRLDRAFTTPPAMANRLRLQCDQAEEGIDLPAADQFAVMIRRVCGLLRGPGDFAAVHGQTRRLHEDMDLLRRGLAAVPAEAP